uniref:NlpC/P60 family n=1 Tax=Siphoviridae sp. ctk5O4 TaxID=2827921 RepID=A0A8S5SKI9_9CAUD|nr:MAG TPA: NlpC/P60 family [Siphoviridae sp. ctk5O4]
MTKGKRQYLQKKEKWLAAILLFAGTTSIITISSGTVTALASDTNTTETVSSNSESTNPSNAAADSTAPSSSNTTKVAAANSESTNPSNAAADNTAPSSSNTTKVAAANSESTNSSNAAADSTAPSSSNTTKVAAFSSALMVTNESEKLINSYKYVGNDVYFLGSDGQPITGLRHYGNNQLEYYGTDHIQYRNKYYQADQNTWYFFGSNGDAITGLRHYGNNQLEYYGTDHVQYRNRYYQADQNTWYFFGSDGDAITGLRHYGNNQLEYYGTDHIQYRNKTAYVGNTSYYCDSHGNAQVSSLSRQMAIINLARTKLGDPYTQSQAGRLGPNSFDCSGFVYYLYKTAAGITLNGTVTTTEETSGREVSLNELQPGDLLFYGSRGNTYHVGLYEGNGMMIHAATPEEGVKETAIKYYQPTFARRIIG